MNKSPLNYVISFGIAAILWFVSAIILGDYLSDIVTLEDMTIEGFLLRYRATLAIAAILALGGIYFWYYYGSDNTLATQLDKAKRTWNLLFFTQLAVAGLAVFIFAIMMMGQGVSTFDFVIMFVALTLQTYGYFWLCSFLFSPRTVAYCVLGKRKK